MSSISNLYEEAPDHIVSHRDFGPWNVPQHCQRPGDDRLGERWPNDGKHRAWPRGGCVRPKRSRPHATPHRCVSAGRADLTLAAAGEVWALVDVADLRHRWIAGPAWPSCERGPSAQAARSRVTAFPAASPRWDKSGIVSVRYAPLLRSGLFRRRPAPSSGRRHSSPGQPARPAERFAAGPANGPRPENQRGPHSRGAFRPMNVGSLRARFSTYVELPIYTGRNRDRSTPTRPGLRDPGPHAGAR